MRNLIQKIRQKVKRILSASSKVACQHVFEADQIAQGGGERQAAPTVDGIRSDHVARYELAVKFIPENAVILDMACGVGYGSNIFATKTDCELVLAVDRSEDAIEYARQYYNSPKIVYRQDDCSTTPLDPESFDVAASFETIEHIKEDKKLLNLFFKVLKQGGKLILSTPNQLKMIYTSERFPFHVRHYTPAELTDLLESVGFSVDKVFSQPDSASKTINLGSEGQYLIFICSKP